MHDSLIAIGNGGTKPVSAEFTIFYNRGQDRYDLEQALQPDEQMWIDVGRLIREQIPDKNGKHLPSDLETGSYSFRDLTNRAIGSLFEGKVIYDKSYGHVAYGCSACCGITSVYLTYNPFYTLMGPGYTNGVEDNDNCGDRGVDVSGDFYNWDTANHVIATTTIQGHHTGISIGSTTSSTHGNIQRENTRGYCPAVVASPAGPTDVAATPTNFQTYQVQNLTDGTIVFSYTWQSTSGNLADIASCRVGETVHYPGTTSPYPWPAPMVASTTNPTPLYVPGNNTGPNPTTAGLGDYNKPPDSYSTPYSPGSSFNATQTLQWECPDFNNGAYYRFVPDITIARRVFLDTTDNKWKYQISKSGQTNTVILPNQ